MKNFSVKVALMLAFVGLLTLSAAATNLTTEQILNNAYDSSTRSLTFSLTSLNTKDSTAFTATPTYPLSAQHETSGTPAAGIGVGIEFIQETSASNNETVMKAAAIMTDVTATSEDADFVLLLMDAGAAAAERLRVDSDGKLTFVNSGVLDNTTNGTILFDEPSAATNTAINILTVGHSTSGTATTGIGTGIAFQAENASGTAKTGMALQTIATDAVAATEDFDFVVKLMKGGAAAAEAFRVTSTGVVSLVNSETIDNTVDGTVTYTAPIEAHVNSTSATFTSPTIALDGAVTINGSAADKDFAVKTVNDTGALRVDAGTDAVMFGAFVGYDIAAIDTQSYSISSSSKASRYLSTFSGTSEASTIHLMSNLVVAGRELVILDKGGAANSYNIVIDTQGAEDINGADTLTLSTAYGAKHLLCDGTNWFAY